MFLINTKVFCFLVSFEKRPSAVITTTNGHKVLIKKHKIVAGVVVSLHTCRNRHNVCCDMRQHPNGALIVNTTPIRPSG